MTHVIRLPNPPGITTSGLAGEGWRKWRDRVDEVKGLGEVIIAKTRHSALGKVTLRWDGERTRFSDLERRYG